MLCRQVQYITALLLICFILCSAFRHRITFKIVIPQTLSAVINILPCQGKSLFAKLEYYFSVFSETCPSMGKGCPFHAFCDVHGCAESVQKGCEEGSPKGRNTKDVMYRLPLLV